MSEKILFIVRHAHRNKPQGSAFDNGLSPKGILQAKKLRKRLAKFNKAALISSPKIRCEQTLRPLAKRNQTSIKIDPHLLEKFETQILFEKRIMAFFRSWKRSKAVTTIICSHGDWIPRFTRLTLGTSIPLKKGGYIECRLYRNQFYLYEISQTL